MFIIFSVIDASTIIPNGLIGGSFIDLGNFDECYSIQYKDIYGKYCLGVLPLEVPTPQANLFYQLMFNKTQVELIIVKSSFYCSIFQHFRMFPQPRVSVSGVDFTGLHFAACVPSTMSASDIPGLLTYKEDFCYSKATEPTLSPGTITTIAVLSIVLAIMVFSTFFDIYLYYTHKSKRNFT